VFRLSRSRSHTEYLRRAQMLTGHSGTVKWQTAPYWFSKIDPGACTSSLGLFGTGVNQLRRL